MFFFKFFVPAVFVVFVTPARAEVLNCKGLPQTAPASNFELSVDMDKSKSFLRWVYPDGSGIIQAQSLNRRKYTAGLNTVTYLDQGSTNVSLQVPIASETSLEGRFTHMGHGLNAVPVQCELLGSIPPAPTCPKNKDAALLSAMDTAQTLDEVEYLLSCGANVNAVNAKGCTPLMLAIDPECHPGGASGQLHDVQGLIDLFLNNGAFVNTQDKRGESALMKAADAGLGNVYESFIAAEADFDLQDRKGNTALMHSAREGDKSVIKEILEGNPNRRLKNKKGQTAYDIAKRWHDQETADLVKNPDSTLTIVGSSDGTCAPLNAEIKVGQTVEVRLQAIGKMFLLKSAAIGLEIMADGGQTAGKILTFANRGSFKFTCGFHGSATPSEGTITVR